MTPSHADCHLPLCVGFCRCNHMLKVCCCCSAAYGARLAPPGLPCAVPPMLPQSQSAQCGGACCPFAAAVQEAATLARVATAYERDLKKVQDALTSVLESGAVVCATPLPGLVSGPLRGRPCQRGTWPLAAQQRQLCMQGWDTQHVVCHAAGRCSQSPSQRPHGSLFPCTLCSTTTPQAWRPPPWSQPPSRLAGRISPCKQGLR